MVADLDDWGAVPVAGCPEDGELEQTGIPEREPPRRFPRTTSAGTGNELPLNRLEVLVRRALESPDNARPPGQH